MSSLGVTYVSLDKRPAPTATSIETYFWVLQSHASCGLFLLPVIQANVHHQRQPGNQVADHHYSSAVGRGIHKQGRHIDNADFGTDHGGQDEIVDPVDDNTGHQVAKIHADKEEQEAGYAVS